MNMEGGFIDRFRKLVEKREERVFKGIPAGIDEYKFHHQDGPIGPRPLSPNVLKFLEITDFDEAKKMLIEKYEHIMRTKDKRYVRGDVEDNNFCTTIFIKATRAKFRKSDRLESRVDNLHAWLNKLNSRVKYNVDGAAERKDELNKTIQLIKEGIKDLESSGEIDFTKSLDLDDRRRIQRDLDVWID